MRKHFRIIVATLLILGITGVSLSAQSNNYRSKGYRGSFSVTDHYGVFVGAEILVLDNVRIMFALSYDEGVVFFEIHR